MQSILSFHGLVKQNHGPVKVIFVDVHTDMNINHIVAREGIWATTNMAKMLGDLFPKAADMTVGKVAGYLRIRRNALNKIFNNGIYNLAHRLNHHKVWFWAGWHKHITASKQTLAAVALKIPCHRKVTAAL